VEFVPTEFIPPEFIPTEAIFDGYSSGAFTLLPLKDIRTKKRLIWEQRKKSITQVKRLPPRSIIALIVSIADSAVHISKRALCTTLAPEEAERSDFIIKFRYSKKP